MPCKESICPAQGLNNAYLKFYQEEFQVKTKKKSIDLKTEGVMLKKIKKTPFCLFVVSEASLKNVLEICSFRRR